MKDNLLDFYQARLIEIQRVIAVQKRKFSKFALYRITCLIAILLAVYGFYISDAYLPLSIGLLVLSLIFGFLVKKHLAIKHSLRKMHVLADINANEAKAIQGDFSFNDDGREFLKFEHPNAFDLDLFGKGSFFQRIARVTILEGSQRLAETLTHPNSDEIADRQQIFKELAEKIDWRQQFQAEGLLYKKERLGYAAVKSWLEAPLEFAHKKWLSVLLFISPLIFFMLLAGYGLGWYSGSVAGMYFLLQLAMIGVHLKHINRFHAALSKKQGELEAYANLLEVAVIGAFEHEHLQKLKEQAEGGSAAIKKFSRLIGLLDSRLNMLMGILLNGAFLWDLRYIVKIEKWKLENATKLEEWIYAISELEVHSSFANYVFNHKDFSWPDISSEKAIAAIGLGHPFLDAEKRVCNDFELLSGGQLVLLSGANMSGKSTFLRTVGLNLLMGQLGLPVCAKSFVFKPIPVYTSMRINDSLQESESYFFAELKRLKFVIDTIKDGREIFILLDEILRGTNSNDKHKGSIGLIEQLLRLNTTGIIASHDVTLSSLATEHPGKILNRSFEVENQNGELVFDYTLREGVCQNLNASYLMEKMGVIER